jgi:hypothetical protein
MTAVAEPLASPAATRAAVWVEAWHRCWFVRFDPISLGIFRIFLGALITLFYLALAPNWERFYAADGVLSLTGAVGGADPWTLFSWTEAWFPIRVYWLAGVLASVLFTIGWHTRVSTIILFVLESSLLIRSPQAMNGEDVIFRMLLFYGMFAPLGAALSIDRLLKDRRCEPGPEQLPEIWAVRAMQLNFALIYAISLPNKLADDVAWWSGDAVYLAVASNMWGRWPWPELLSAADGALSKLFTYGTIAVEGSFPLLVWFRRTRIFVIAAAAFLHIGIAITLNGVSFFSLAMLCALWIFVPPDAARRFIRWLS